MSAHLKLLCTALVAFTLGMPQTFGAESPQIQIRKFRFHQHLSLDFERLVLEFSQKHGNSVPTVRVTPVQGGREAALNVLDATLVGAIPEANINDAYAKTSRYIGPISISNDNPTLGFSIRTFVKNPNVSIDAFWLKNPTRLIVDVFPKNSLRAQGPDVLRNQPSRGIASHRPGKTNRNVICFFTAAQVQASLGFELGNAAKPYNMVVDDSGVNYAADKNVICYPSSAQAQPKISFDMKPGTPRYTLEVQPKTNVPQFQTQVPTPAPRIEWGAGRPLTKEEQLNRDADLALGLPGDADLEARGLASPGLFGGVDNFDKNKPPPTLGKAIGPLGKSPSLAAPGGLLPPTKR